MPRPPTFARSEIRRALQEAAAALGPGFTRQAYEQWRSGHPAPSPSPTQIRHAYGTMSDALEAARVARPTKPRRLPPDLRDPIEREALKVLQLLFIMLQDDSWTYHDFAAKLGCSKRTVQRHVRALRDLGFDVIRRKRRVGGDQLKLVGASPELLQLLRIEATTMSPAKRFPFRDRLSK